MTSNFHAAWLLAGDVRRSLKHGRGSEASHLQPTEGAEELKLNHMWQIQLPTCVEDVSHKNEPLVSDLMVSLGGYGQ